MYVSCMDQCTPTNFQLSPNLLNLSNLLSVCFFLIYRTDDAFERNKKDVFKIKTTDLGPLKKLMWELKIIATYMYM